MASRETCSRTVRARSPCYANGAMLLKFGEIASLPRHILNGNLASTIFKIYTKEENKVVSTFRLAGILKCFSGFSFSVHSIQSHVSIVICNASVACVLPT